MTAVALGVCNGSRREIGHPSQVCSEAFCLECGQSVAVEWMPDSSKRLLAHSGSTCEVAP